MFIVCLLNDLLLEVVKISNVSDVFQQQENKFAIND